MDTPIACTLDFDSARAQLREWRDVLANVVERCDRVEPTKARLVLVDEVKDVSTLANLAQLETRCCTFFHFTIDVTATNFALVVEVPTDASPLLAGFLDEISPEALEDDHQVEVPVVANSSASRRDS
jgi:hypothetical protein